MTVELVTGLIGALSVVFAALVENVGADVNIGNPKWHYNNTLNKLTKANKPNTTQYYVYNYQGKRVRTVIESSHQVQSQRDCAWCDRLVRLLSVS
jgi:hypothetical protein